MRYLLVGMLILGFWHGGVAAKPVAVYAAASLGSALEDLAQTVAQRGMEMKFSFGSSSTMAKQIEAGAPADIYFSAHEKWMDYLENRALIAPGTRANLLGNALVVIVPKGEGFELDLRLDFGFAGAFDGRLALGDPTHVPAGIYARQALETLGWWSALQGRIVPAGDVCAALALVERGECPAGMVYATDAAVSQGVEVIGVLPDSLHAPIVYPLAVVKGRHTATVVAAWRFFQSDEAAAVFKRYGFQVLGAKNGEEE